MNEHDPLCGSGCCTPDTCTHNCRCDLIAEVRADEREKVVGEAVVVIDRVMSDADDSVAAILLMIAASRVETLADSRPADLAEGRGREKP